MQDEVEERATQAEGHSFSRPLNSEATCRVFGAVGDDVRAGVHPTLWGTTEVLPVFELVRDGWLPRSTVVRNVHHRNEEVYHVGGLTIYTIAY
jgi:hypothetical protein